MELSKAEFNLLRAWLASHSGIDVPEGKEYLFINRLSEFMGERKFTRFSEFHNHLTEKKDPALEKQFIQFMTTHESSFFRDRHPFSLLQKTLLPRLAARKQAEAQHYPPKLSILSAGCSFGQEPYSIAIVLREWLAGNREWKEENIFLLATDISAKAIARAQKGDYLPMEVGRQIPDHLAERYFQRQGERMLLADRVKSMVRFAELNLAEPFTQLGRFDLIFCRNVIIYFPLEVKKRILNNFHTILNPGGALFMGAAEPMFGLTDKFRTVEDGKAIYFEPIK